MIKANDAIFIFCFGRGFFACDIDPTSKADEGVGHGTCRHIHGQVGTQP